MITNFYNDIFKSLNKLVVFITLKEKDGYISTYLATRNVNLISDFNAVFAAQEYESNIDELYIEAYEVRYDKTVRINIKDVSHFTFFGIPNEIQPPVFLNARYEHLLSEDQLHSFQRAEFLQKVKSEKEAGHYDIEQPHTIEETRSLLSIKHFLETEYDINVNDHSLFEFYDNHYRHYNMASDSIKGKSILELFKNVNFMPIVGICEGLDKSQLKQLIPQGVDMSTFTDLKEKWIAFLYKKRDEVLQKTISDRENIDSIYFNNLKEKITPYVSDAEKVIKIIHDRQGKQSELGDFLLLIAEHPTKENFVDWEYMYQDPLHITGEGHANAQQVFAITKEIFEGCTAESIGIMCKDIVDSFHECNSVKDQYDLIIGQLQSINIEDELSLYNDYRLYLRYWPEIFPDHEDFHAKVRPFTVLENKVIKILITMGVELDCDELYRREYDYYNSCIEILQKYVDVCRVNRLQQIMSVATVRADQIKDEMKSLIDNLSAEEKQQLEGVMNELVNYDNYKKDLDVATKLIDVLSYWPVSLYPAPSSVLVP